MVKNPKIDNDEINLIELMCTLWKGKWKIAVAVIISLILVISYQSIKTKNFTAVTEIKPIGDLELNKFFEYNNLIATITKTNTNINTNTNTNTNTGTNTGTGAIGTSVRVNIEGKINKFTSLRLLSIYINLLNDKSVFEDAIRKFNLLETSQYNNEQEYSEAIIRLASSIKILSPAVSANKKKGNLEASYHTINFTHHDAEKWKSVLTHVDEIANKLVKKTIIEEFNNNITFLKNNRKYELEDISTRINNQLIDYERETSDQIAYLEEQSAIAKKLGIVKNTIEVQTFGNQNALLSNIQTDSPFYLRGYEAIDKEIELIQLRKNKKAFIKGYFELEKTKRAIEQDQTIERLELAFQSNLLTDKNDFFVASINAIATKFEYNDNKKMLILAIVAGLIVGIFYVLISNALQSPRVSKKN